MGLDEEKVITVSNKNFSKLLESNIGEEIIVEMGNNKNMSIKLEVVEVDFFDSPHKKNNNSLKNKKSSPIQRKYENKNPFNSRYGLYVYKSFDCYRIRKSIHGESIVFGVYENLSQAYFIRDFLMENEWDVNQFREIEFNEKTQKYYIIKVIDYDVCIIGEFDTFEEAEDNLVECYKDFIANIFKHKNLIEQHYHLNYLIDKFDQLYFEFDQTVEDDEFWLIDRLPKIEELSKVNKSKYNFDSLYGLTPWQKIIRDEIKKLNKDVFTFDELKNSLLRYKTKNFDKKVREHLNELIDLDLVKCLGNDIYEKCW